MNDVQTFRKITAAEELTAFRDILKEKIDYINSIKGLNNQQNVHTPFDLCKEIVDKLVEFTDLKGKYICVLNLEFVEVLCYDFGVERKNIWFITDCKEKAKILSHPRYKGVNVCVGDYLLTECKDMKFDVIVGNPPYQIKVGDTNTEPIWHKFVEKSLLMLKDGGFLCFVHPSGWRDVNGRFKNVGNLISSKNVKYLEIHDEKDGLKTFGAETRYDWYVLQNSKKRSKAIVKFQDDVEKKIDIATVPFLPNASFDMVMSLLAKDGETKCEIISDYSYAHRADYISSKKTRKFNKPIVYTIAKGDIPNFLYSSENRGHFGIPKLIWSNGRIVSIGTIIDDLGEYGLSEYSAAIIDCPNNLRNIKKAFDSEKFRSLMTVCSPGGMSMNNRLLALFRKDFWKHFVDENGSEL